MQAAGTYRPHMNILEIKLNWKSKKRTRHFIRVQAYGLVVWDDRKGVDFIGQDGKSVVAKMIIAHGVSSVEYIGPVLS